MPLRTPPLRRNGAAAERDADVCEANARRRAPRRRVAASRGSRETLHELNTGRVKYPVDENVRQPKLLHVTLEILGSKVDLAARPRAGRQRDRAPEPRTLPHRPQPPGCRLAAARSRRTESPATRPFAQGQRTTSGPTHPSGAGGDTTPSRPNSRQLPPAVGRLAGRRGSPGSSPPLSPSLELPCVPLSHGSTRCAG
jgi:hypothetical protein